jgi:hypothetical protein
MNFFTSDTVITYYHKLMMRTILFPNYFYFFSIHYKITLHQCCRNSFFISIF